MKLMKVFLTSEMPDPIWNHLRNCGVFVKDGYGSYDVGRFVKEATKDPPNYDADEVEQANNVDTWFVQNGAKHNETILIEHG